jgi:hypothetical protein
MIARMKGVKRSALILLFVFSAIVPGTARTASTRPSAAVDRIDATTIAGWAKDDDVPGRPVLVHIYVDGKLFDTAQASPRFEYRHAPFGAGRHKIDVYVLGVNAAGALDGQNVRATGLQFDDFGCAPMTGDRPAELWCRDMPVYWENRQRDTAALFNKYIWIGVNNSYGGMISQLYSEDRTTNLLQEHGGAAMQLSLWGYDTSAAGGPDAFYRKSPPANPRCDPTPFPTLAACTAGGHVCDGVEGSPSRPQHGRQVTTCANVCNGWEVAAPWNPLQAQGAQCSWDDRAKSSKKAHNNVAQKGPFVDAGRPGWRILHNSVSHFTKGKTIAGQRGKGTFPGLAIEQKVTLGDVYAKVQYTVRYARNARYTLGVHPQEIPAIYTGKGIAIKAYRPGEPEKDTCVHGSPGCDGTANLPKDGGWWGVCDASGTKCLTVATFDGGVITRDTVERAGDGYGMLTAAADFALVPGLVKSFTIYLFPYRFDKVIEGRTIVDRINALKLP